MPDLPQNPYDRRDRPQTRGGRSIGDHEYALAQDTGPLPPEREPSDRLDLADEVDTPNLTLRDLELLISTKVRRARRDGDDAAYLREREGRLAAQRQAFDEGAYAGARARGLALHAQIEQELGKAIHDLHERAVAIVEADRKTKAGRDLQTVKNLVDFALRVAHVTDQAITTHTKELRHFAETGQTTDDVGF